MRNIILITLVAILFTACSSRPSSTGNYKTTNISPVKAGIFMQSAKIYVQQGRINEKAKQFGNTALIYSVTNASHIKITEYLINNGANINYKNTAGISALGQAFAVNNTKGALLLIQRGANIYEKDTLGRNLLFKTLNNGDIQSTELLLSKGLKIQKNTKDELYKQIQVFENAKKTHPQYSNIYNKSISNVQKGINFLNGNTFNYTLASVQPVKKTDTKLQKKIEVLEKKKDYLALKKLANKEANTIYYLKNKDMKLLFTGPKQLKVGDIRELMKSKKDILIVSLIKRVKEPYKEFSLDEIDRLGKLGISDKIISAMLDKTTQLNEQKAIKPQKVQTKVIYKTQPVQKQNNTNTLGNEIQKQLINEGAKRLFKSLF